MVKKTANKNPAMDLDQQDRNRVRAAANKAAKFIFHWDKFIVIFAVMYVCWIAHFAPSQTTEGKDYDNVKVLPFDLGRWFIKTTAVTVVVAFAIIIWGINEVKNDSDKKVLLQTISIICAVSCCTSFFDLIRTHDPITLLASAGCFVLSYLHYGAAESYMFSDVPLFTATTPALSKTEGMLCRMVLLADGVALSGIAALRVLAGLTNPLSLPIAAITAVVSYALICLRASATPCLHQLRFVLSGGVVFCVSLFLSTADTVPDWNTGTIRLISICGFVAHTVCFFTHPVLRIMISKWGRFKRWVLSWNPGDAYGQE